MTSKFYVLSDTRTIPKLNKNTYLSYHIHISALHDARYPPYVILASKQKYILDDLKRKSKVHYEVSEIAPDDLAFYSSKTSTNIAVIDNCYCNIADKKELCVINVL